MYGVKAFLIFLGFAVAAGAVLAAVFDLWRQRRRGQLGIGKLLGVTGFVLLWVSLISSVYIRKAHFQGVLWKLSATDVYSIQIGHHEFRDQETIQDIVAALRHSRWFEVNHGGWGDSVPMTLQRHSGEPLRIDVALYFREPAAIIGPANRQGLGYSATESFVPELPRALERHGVELPNCDTAHDKPCTAEQLNP